jgi:hypothetical protein
MSWINGGWSSRSCCTAANCRPIGKHSLSCGCRWPECHHLGALPPFNMAPYGIRTLPAVVVLTSSKPHGHRPAKTSRIALRATEDDRDLLERPSPFAVPVVDQPQGRAATTRRSCWRTITSSQVSAAAPRSRPPGWWRWPSRPMAPAPEQARARSGIRGQVTTTAASISGAGGQGGGCGC